MLDSSFANLNTFNHFCRNSFLFLSWWLSSPISSHYANLNIIMKLWLKNMCHLNKVNPVMSNKDTVDTELFCTCPGTANTTQDTTLIPWDLRILVSFLKQSTRDSGCHSSCVFYIGSIFHSSQTQILNI